MSLPFLAGQAPEFTAMKALFLTVFAFYRKIAVVEARAALITSDSSVDDTAAPRDVSLWSSTAAAPQTTARGRAVLASGL